MSTHKIGTRPCPYCGRVNMFADNTFGQDGAMEGGDFSICVGCGNVALVQDDGAHRKIEFVEWMAIDEATREKIVVLQRALRSRRMRHR
jgi:hypothetical protein